MKKVAVYAIFSLVLMSMSSCFLFQTHENCPAYGDNQEINNTDPIELNEEAKA